MIEIDVSGLEETTDAIYQMNLGVGKNMSTMVGNLTQDMAEGMRGSVPTWSGELKGSIDSEITEKGSVTVGVAKASADHAAPVELGTGKLGPKGTRYFPNPTNINAWAVGHGFKSGWHLAAVIYYVTGGTKPTYFARETFKDVASKNLGRRAKKFIDSLVD